jgi:Short C-terminal domain
VEPIKTSRDQIPNLLTRPPLLGWQVACPWPHPLVDPVQQLEALADLFRRGLLSRDEFEREKQKVHSE